MQRYCLGFMFSQDYENVVLIKKESPDWMKGLLNGVGGKLLNAEDPLNGMKREFKEETGLQHDSWTYFATINGDDFEVICFTTTSNNYLAARTVTPEKICITPTNHVKMPNTEKYVHHVPALIGCAIDKKLIQTVFYVNY